MKVSVCDIERDEMDLEKVALDTKFPDFSSNALFTKHAIIHVNTG